MTNSIAVRAQSTNFGQTWIYLSGFFVVYATIMYGRMDKERAALLVMSMVAILVVCYRATRHYEVLVDSSGIHIRQTKRSWTSFMVQNKERYLSRDELLDCVVNEVVLAHRVISMVVFRLVDARGAIDATAEETQKVKLFEAFPDIELNFVECLTVRNQIMELIAKEKVQ